MLSKLVKERSVRKCFSFIQAHLALTLIGAIVTVVAFTAILNWLGETSPSADQLNGAVAQAHNFQEIGTKPASDSHPEFDRKAVALVFGIVIIALFCVGFTHHRVAQRKERQLLRKVVYVHNSSPRNIPFLDLRSNRDNIHRLKGSNPRR